MLRLSTMLCRLGNKVAKNKHGNTPLDQVCLEQNQLGVAVQFTSTTSSRCTMFLCRICFRIETSLSKLCFSFLFNLSVEISLIATTFPVSLCMAFHTIANEPEPAFCCKTQAATLLKLESLILASVMSVSPLVCQQRQPGQKLYKVVATQRARERNKLLSGCAYSLHGASAGVCVVSSNFRCPHHHPNYRSFHSFILC